MILLVENNDPSHINILKIGAYKGNIQNDNLYLTINRNLKIIFVEPVTKYYNELIMNYNNKYIGNKFMYLNKAVSNKIGTMNIYYPSITNDFNNLPWWIEQCSGTNPIHFKDHGYDIDLDCIKIPTTTINEIVKENAIKHIDYLTVDTEGHDYEILMHMDLTIIKPTYISFEHLHMDGYNTQGIHYKGLIDHFEKHGYKITNKDCDNTYMKLV